MRKIVLYIATSLNGKIARKDGSIDWLESLPNPDKTDHGYNEFLQSIDTTIMGNNTYNQIMSWGIEFPYPDKKNFVFTTNKNLTNNEHVEFVAENQIEFVKELKKQYGKDIWLLGGGQLNTLFFNEDLIDECRIFIMPVVIPDGIGLFEFVPKEKILKLEEIKSFSSGAVQLKYVLS